MAQTAAGPVAGTRELTDENIFQLLAQGVLISMEDDLRSLQGEQAKTAKEKRTPAPLKAVAREAVSALTTPAPRKSFWLKIKGKLAKKSEAPRIHPAPGLPSSVFPAVGAKPDPVIKKKELASGLRLGEKIIEQTEEVRPSEPSEPRPAFEASAQTPFLNRQIAAEAPLPSAASTTVVAQLLPDDLKAEPYAIDDLQERIKGKSRFEQEKNELDAKLQVFWPQRRPLELKVAALREEKQALAKSLSPFTVKDAQLKALEKDIAEKEKKAQLPQERHQLEEQRWALEKQRKDIEKQKWSQEEALDAKNAEIQAAEMQFQAVLAQEGALRERKAAVLEELEKISLAQERLMLIDKAAGFDSQRRNLNKEKSALVAEENLFSKELKETGDQERALEAQEVSLEEAIEKASSFKEKKEISQSKWQLDEQRKNIEQKRWELEKKIAKSKEDTAILGKNYDEILRKQMAVEIRAEDIDILLRRSFADAEKVLSVRSQQKERIEAAKKQEIESRSEQLRPLLPVLQPVREAGALSVKKDEGGARPAHLPSEQRPAPIGEETFSEAEVQTAAKIQQKAREREREKKLALIQQQAQAQRESPVLPKIKGPISKADILLKLSQVSPEEQANRERFLARVAGRAPNFAIKPERNGKEIMFRPLIRKSSFFEKILARVFFLLTIFVIVAGLAALVYFYVISPGPKVHSPSAPVVGESPAASVPLPEPVSAEPSATTSAPEIIATTTTPTSVPAVVLPEPLIAVGTTTVFEAPADASMDNLLKIALQDNRGSGLNEIVFKASGDVLLGLNDVLAVMRSSWPENIGQQLDSASTLLVSGEASVSRFGFIVKVKDSSAVAAAMKAWEPDMENDWAALWTALGKTGPALNRYFLNAKYQGVSFRYQTFTKQDFGICYAVTGDYLAVATSYSQMKLILDAINAIAGR
ncbi:MAG: hypothetical protein PHU56_03800 [Candidatus Pacebacteria bacterium]|nr:hypothetical protein [Candidatus Paceibacterota bacterium]